MEINNIKTAYFLGIGGIGMSAIARYLKNKGVNVAGYDKTPTPLTLSLEKEGINIHYEANINLIPQNTDIVVFTPAVPTDFEEWNYINKKNIPTIKRSEILSKIINNLKTIAVAGTHGKTTTSAIIAHIFENSKKPFIGFVGGILNQYNKNIFIHKNAEWAVAEADEYDRSFLALKPYISIINAIDADHLDIYGNQNELIKSFSKFVSQTSENGKVFIYDEIEKNKLELPNNVIIYGFSNKLGYSARNIRIEKNNFYFDVYYNDLSIQNNIMMPIAGKHNIQNALAAFAATHTAGFKTNEIAAAIQTFPGVKRRLELIAKNEKLIYYDDYAHHPAEIEALISAIREIYPNKIITGIFQPHLYTRTRDFGKEFALALAKLDYPIITDIYPAREIKIQGIDAFWLLNQIENTNKKHIAYNEIPTSVHKIKDGILLTIGAGNIDAHVNTLKTNIEQQ